MAARKLDCRRVYFIGAGFTACQGYPLGGQLIVRLLDWLKTQGEDSEKPGYSTIARGIRRMILRVLQEYLRQNLDTVDVSEFYTLVQMMSETPALFDKGPDLKNLYDAVSAATAELLLAIWCEKDLDPLPAAILNKIDPSRHAIVDFDWDEEVDSYLTTEEAASRGDDVAYTLGSWENDPSAKMPYLLLKPHGSAGWFDIAEGISNAGAYFICESDPRIARRERRIISYIEVEAPMPIGGGESIECPRVITPPTFAKRFHYPEQQLVWQDVIAACSGATEFVFLGYTLRPDDYLTRTAIRNALRVAQIEEIKCLVMAHPSDEQAKAILLSNFRSVFGEGVDERRNFLLGDFGEPKSFPNVLRSGEEGANDVVHMMEESVKTATVTEIGKMVPGA